MMKSALVIATVLTAFFLLSACETVDPLKDLPQTEYEQAQKYKERIAKWRLEQYAPDEYALAETAYKAGEDKYKKENLAAKKSFDEANLNYRTVIRKGIIALRLKRGGDVDLRRQKADEIKSRVAVAADYKAAQDAYERAMALAEEEKWEEAEPLFAEAESKFEAVFEAAKVKKDKADNQFEATKKRLEELKQRGAQPDGE